MTRSTKFPGARGTVRAVLNALTLGRERRDLLESHGWYRGLTGGWVHPHCMDFMSAAEIRRLTPAQLAYKLHYGSRAALPPDLA